MTYEEQLKIEKLNKQIIQKIINENRPEEFINFYTDHTQKETIEHFGLRNVKQLRKILEIFEYDFSKPKPSHFKGKKAARSHESYIEGGKKSRQTQKGSWAQKTEEEKETWSQKMAKAHSTEAFKEKIVAINKKYQASLTEEQREQIRNIKSKTNLATWQVNKKEILAKSYITKKQNKSFNSSKPEDNYYLYLLSIYNEEDIVRQYKDHRYPHACDFYIKPLDLFIELNLSWTHGGKPFEGTEADLAKLSIWQKKAKTSKYYEKAIKTWTVLDVQKIKDANKNKLNYKVYYSEEDLYGNGKQD